MNEDPVVGGAFGPSVDHRHDVFVTALKECALSTSSEDRRSAKKKQEGKPGFFPLRLRRGTIICERKPAGNSLSSCSDIAYP